MFAGIGGTVSRWTQRWRNVDPQGGPNTWWIRVLGGVGLALLAWAWWDSLRSAHVWAIDRLLAWTAGAWGATLVWFGAIQVLAWGSLATNRRDVDRALTVGVELCLLQAVIFVVLGTLGTKGFWGEYWLWDFRRGVLVATILVGVVARGIRPLLATDEARATSTAVAVTASGAAVWAYVSAPTHILTCFNSSWSNLHYPMGFALDGLGSLDIASGMVALGMSLGLIRWRRSTLAAGRR